MRFAKRTLGSSDLRVSPLGLGALHFGVYTDQKKATELVHFALDHGINFIDTAPMYGQGLSEEMVGKALKGRREQMIVSTKVGLIPKLTEQGTFGVETQPLTEENIRSSLERSLRSLGTETIDLLQLHAFDRSVPFEKTFKVLKALQAEGKIRYFGCSNYSRQEFESACEVMGEFDFASFQVHYNLIERRAKEELFPVCAKRNVGIITNRILARGLLSGRLSNRRDIPASSRAGKSERIRKALTPEVFTLITALGEFADRTGRSLAELAMGWQLAQPEVSVALMGVQSVEQIESFLRVIENPVSQSLLSEIEGAIVQAGAIKQVHSVPNHFLEK